MTTASIGPEIERLIQLLAKLPGLGPRSARRVALTLLKKRDVTDDIAMEKDLTPDLLSKRTAIFIHTEDLLHDQVMTKRDYYSLFLKTSALTKKND